MSIKTELGERFHAVLQDFVAWEKKRVGLARTKTGLAPSAAMTAATLDAQFGDERSRFVPLTVTTS